MPDANGVILYTTEPCGFCRQAKALLEARGVAYSEVNLAIFSIADRIIVPVTPDLPAMRAAIQRLERQALASGQMHQPITVDVNADATVANITVPIAGTGTDPASNTALTELRDVIVPATVGAVLAGWAFAQRPFFLPHEVTLRDAAADDVTLAATLIVLVIALLVIVPSLFVLFRLTLDQRLRGPLEPIFDVDEGRTR